MEIENTNVSGQKVIDSPNNLANKPPKVLFKEMKVQMNRILLNVRKEPNIESEVISQLSNGTRVNVNLDKSTNDFYYVASKITEAGVKVPVHGYCAKAYIHE